MISCCTDFRSVAGTHFNDGHAVSDLKRYRRKGPNPTTRLLRDMVGREGGGRTLLDVGGGIGALSFELLAEGFVQATIVDASTAYVATARCEAERRGYTKRVTLQEGDFVEIGKEIPAAEVVLMDRVVCCYPHFQPLLEEAFRHSGRLFALSYPRDLWYVRLVVATENAVRFLRRAPFRVFVHRASRMRALAERHGFRCLSQGGTLAWSVELYARREVTS